MEGDGREPVALVRARRPRRRRGRDRDGPARVAGAPHAARTIGGLAAFEDAPCFLELVGEEAQRYRDGGESVTGTP